MSAMQKEEMDSIKEVVRLIDELNIELTRPGFDRTKLEMSEKLYKSFKSIYYNTKKDHNKMLLQRKILELHKRIEDHRHRIASEQKKDKIRLLVSCIDQANKALDYRNLRLAGKFYTDALGVFSGVEFKSMGRKVVMAKHIKDVHERMVEIKKNEMHSECTAKLNQIKTILKSAVFAYNNKNYENAANLYTEAKKLYSDMPDMYPGLKADAGHEIESSKNLFLGNKLYSSRMIGYAVHNTNYGSSFKEEHNNMENRFDILFNLVDQMHDHLGKNEVQLCKDKYAYSLKLVNNLRDSNNKNMILNELDKIYSRLLILSEIEKTMKTESKEDIIRSLNSISGLHTKHAMGHPDDRGFLSFVEERHGILSKMV